MYFELAFSLRGERLMLRKLISILLMVIFLAIINRYYFSDLESLKKENNTPPPAIEKINLGAELSLLSAPIWIAEYHGYFKQQGLDVNIIEFDSGKASFMAMLEQQGVDISTVAPTPIMFSSFNRQDFSIIATFVHSDDDVKVIARNDKGIIKAKDLVGKKIATPSGTTGQFFVDAFLTFNNIPVSQVEILNISPANLPEALQKDRVDAIVIWEPHAYEAQQLMHDKTIRIPSKNIYMETFNFMAMNRFTNTHPESIKKFLLAISKAINFIDNNQQLAQQIVARKLVLDGKIVKHLWPDYNYALSLNQELIVTLEMEARWAVREKLTDKIEIPNYFNYIYFQALEQTNPKGVNIFQ